VHVARRLVDRDHGRLAENDAAPAHVDEGVGGAEVDRHVATAEPGQVVEDAHDDRGHSTLPTSALLLALGSAALHAAWNLLIARARDVEAAAAATFVLSIALVAPFAVVWWEADADVWPYALASALLELAYLAGLANAYRTSDVSFVYPVTRGLAPVLTLAFAVVVLGHGASAAEVGGVLLVGIGVVLVRGVGAGGDARGLLLVAAIATSIAAYTLVDRAGIQHAGALTYFLLVLAGPSLAYPLLVGKTAALRQVDASTVAAAAANVGSFVLALLALRSAAAAPVLAVRSSSIVIATLLAGRLLAEQVGVVRAAGSVLVFAGVALLAT
jgi:drug/metabolite transporter (DMT)-like permease